MKRLFSLPIAWTLFTSFAHASWHTPCRSVHRCDQGYDCKMSVASPYCENESAMHTLANQGTASINSSAEDGVFTFDASAVLAAAPESVITASLCYDAYAQWGMPNVVHNHTIATETPAASEVDLLGKLVIWSHMRLAEIPILQSYHFFSVINFRNFNGIAWKQVPSEDLPFRPSQEYTDSSAFDWIRGSFYVYPLDAEHSYVRYFVSSKVQFGDLLSLPIGNFNASILEAMTPGVARVLRIIGERSQTTPPCSRP